MACLLKTRGSKMSLTNKDIERIGEIMSAKLVAELKDITESVRQLNQTVYGVDFKNGLRGTVKEHGEELVELKTFKTKAMVYISIISTGAATLVASGIKYFFK